MENKKYITVYSLREFIEKTKASDDTEIYSLNDNKMSIHRIIDISHGDPNGLYLETEEYGNNIKLEKEFKTNLRTYKVVISNIDTNYSFEETKVTITLIPLSTASEPVMYDEIIYTNYPTNEDFEEAALSCIEEYEDWKIVED